MNIDNFEDKIQAAQKDFERMLQSGRESENYTPEVVAQMVTELSVYLEELHVAKEELYHQNQELNLTRQELELERSRYRELFEKAPDGYIVTNKKGTIEDANCAAVKMLNVRRQYIIGKPLVTFVALDDRHRFRIQLNQLGEIQQLIDWEVWLQPRDRELFISAISISRIQDCYGNLMGWRWLIRDITERKQVEETRRQLEVEQELSELKSRFIRTVSHEFRTPLNVIYLCSQLLEKYSQRVENPKNPPLFQKIRIATRQMSGLLEDVVIFNKAEAKKLEFNPRPMNLREFCLQLVEEQESLQGEGDRTICFTSEGELQTAFLDTKLVQQILNNLISNALKYSPKGSVIHFNVTAQNGKVIFIVQDKGIGIPAEDLPRLFEPFHRATNVGTVSGTGLGLAIVKKAVELHQGEIAIESQVGVGTTFTVTLPLNLQANKFTAKSKILDLK